MIGDWDKATIIRILKKGDQTNYLVDITYNVVATLIKITLASFRKDRGTTHFILTMKETVIIY